MDTGKFTLQPAVWITATHCNVAFGWVIWIVSFFIIADVYENDSRTLLQFIRKFYRMISSTIISVNTFPHLSSSARISTGDAGLGIFMLYSRPKYALEVCVCFTRMYKTTNMLRYLEGINMGLVSSRNTYIKPKLKLVLEYRSCQLFKRKFQKNVLTTIFREKMGTFFFVNNFSWENEKKIFSAQFLQGIRKIVLIGQKWRFTYAILCINPI